MYDPSVETFTDHIRLNIYILHGQSPSLSMSKICQGKQLLMKMSNNRIKKTPEFANIPFLK